MKKIDFITNLSLGENSGGGSGVNFATWDQLRRHFDVNYVGPVRVPVISAQHIVSKAVRMLGLKGNYFFFSEARLRKISAKLSAGLLHSKADYQFFHGITSWISYRPNRPYFTYADACFATYVRIYNNEFEFRVRSLKRIFEQEKEWLGGAARVFFRTRWALEETKKAYGMDGSNFRVAGLGGFIDIPPADLYDGGKNILFISREFGPKGGYHCFEAFKIMHRRNPDFTLTIIGEAPPEEVLNYPNVRYLGLLNKKKENEYNLLKDTVSKAFILVHPTVKDTNALVLTEAGYYGCPSIATRSFAIPELIRDGVTGFLVDTPVNSESIVRHLDFLTNNRDQYVRMRQAVRHHTTTTLVWDKVGDFFHTEIESTR